MAHTYYASQFLYSKIRMLTMIQGTVTIGASGAVSSYTGNGVSSVTKLATGIYQVQTTDNFNAFIQAGFLLESPVTGSNVNDGSFVSGTLYQITAVGTTNWGAIGLASGLTPTVGQVFVATGVGGSGTGTAKAMTTSGIAVVEVPTGIQKMLTNSKESQGIGATVLFETLDITDALANPTSGTVINFTFFFRNSSVAT